MPPRLLEGVLADLNPAQPRILLKFSYFLGAKFEDASVLQEHRKAGNFLLSSRGLLMEVTTGLVDPLDLNKESLEFEEAARNNIGSAV